MQAYSAGQNEASATGPAVSSGLSFILAAQFDLDWRAVKMTHVVAFLRENHPNGVEMLGKQFAIHCSRHKKRPSLILFKYDQLNSPMSHPIVQECRGIVLDESENWKIVVYPYSKFFNMKETANAADIDWSSPVRAYEKIDGSLLTMYHSQGEWHVATSGVPDASGTLHWKREAAAADEGDEVDGDDETSEKEVDAETKEAETKTDPSTGLLPIVQGEHRKTNAELFWEVFKLLNYKIPAPEDESKCYMFELATPQNIVLIPHTTIALYLHGVRDLNTLQEELPDPYVEKYGWTLAPMKLITGGKAQFEKEILVSVNHLDGMKCEGYVICDSRFNRFKLKCTSYVNLALLTTKDGNAWKRLVAIVQVNEGSEFLAYFPQYTELYNSLMARYDQMIAAIEKANTKFASLDSRALASAAADLPTWLKTPLFTIRKKPESIKAFFSTRYGLLSSVLDPSVPFEAPDIDSIDISKVTSTAAPKKKSAEEASSSS